MERNPYLDEIIEYIKVNTPIPFEWDLNTYNKVVNALEPKTISNDIKQVTIAAYYLFYQSLYYHRCANVQSVQQPFYILTGDYISSYVAELLYRKGCYELLNIFAVNTKKMMLNYLNNIKEDQLLEEIVNNIK